MLFSSNLSLQETIIMSNPLVSIILFSYNQEEFLAASIESIINQSYQNLEIIISDNGSTDRSKEIIRSYMSDQRIIFLDHTSNKFNSIRQNEANALSKGKYISVLYSDDYYLLDKIQMQVEIFESLDEDYGLIHGPGYTLSVETNRKTFTPCSQVSGYCMGDLLDQWYEGFINPIAPLVRRHCFIEYPSDEDLFFGGEGLFLKFSMKYKLYLLNKPLGVMREHENNAGKKLRANIEMHHVQLTRLLKHPDFPSRFKLNVEKNLSYFKMNVAWHFIRSNDDFVFAKELYKEGIAWYPKNLFQPKKLIGYILCHCPKLLIRFINALLNMLTGKVIKKSIDK
jgi:glycosyltransferase involved in cell wall biosynthesis